MNSNSPKERGSEAEADTTEADPAHVTERGAFIPLDVAWDQWKAEQIRCAVVCQECNWIMKAEYPCPRGFRSLTEHPQCAAACFKSLAKRQSERRA